MKLSKRNLIIFVIVVVVIVAVGTAFFITGKKKRSEKISGEDYTVQRGQVTNFTEQTGIIKARVGAIVKVGTRATGELTRLNYQVGDYVKKGWLIARIDDREKLANKKDLEAQIEEQRREIDTRIAQHEYNRINYEREQRLLKDNFTTRDSVDKAKKEYDVSMAQIELAKARLKGIEKKLQALEVTLSYYSIYAPISGYVSQVTTQEGETVVAGLSAVNLITVIDSSKLEMWIYVDETDVGRVKPGMKVQYRVDAYRDREFTGKVDLIYPQPEIKENIVYYLAIVKIDPEDAVFLRPEMTTHVSIIIDELGNTLVVPNGAIKFEEGRNVVYVRGKGDRVLRREVKPGIRDHRHTEISSGLNEGERIVIPAAKKAMPGTKK